MDVRGQTERLRDRWEREAGRFDREIVLMERWLLKGCREWLCARAEGEVLEVAVGTGRNLPFYAEGVRLTGIDLSPAMLAIAAQRAERSGMPADLREGDAQGLEFADRSFDSVVCTLAMCEIPDDRGALKEMNRVLRPGGRLLLLDHVASSVPPIRWGQKLLEIPSVRFGGDHLTRRPLEHVVAGGLAIEAHRRSRWGIVEMLVARKPAS